MQVTVRYFTVLRELTEKKQETIELQNEKTNILELLNLLSNKYGKSFRDYVFDQETGRVKNFLQFFVNGQSSAALKGTETELRDGDMVAIVPPVGGG